MLSNSSVASISSPWVADDINLHLSFSLLSRLNHALHPNELNIVNYILSLSILERPPTFLMSESLGLKGLKVAGIWLRAFCWTIQSWKLFQLNQYCASPRLMLQPFHGVLKKKKLCLSIYNFETYILLVKWGAVEYHWENVLDYHSLADCSGVFYIFDSRKIKMQNKKKRLRKKNTTTKAWKLNINEVNTIWTYKNHLRRFSSFFFWTLRADIHVSLSNTEVLRIIHPIPALLQFRGVKKITRVKTERVWVEVLI